MKVLQVNKFLYTVGGSETVMFQTAELLRQQGHEVVFFGMQDARNVTKAQEAYFVSNVDYREQRHGRQLLQLPGMSARFLHSREAAKMIERLVGDENPDVAHLHNIYHQLSPSVLGVLRRRHVPTVMTLHDYKRICPNYTLFANDAICERCKGHRYYQAVLQGCVKQSRVSSALCTVEAYAHHFTRAYERGVDHYIAPSRFLRDKMIEFGMEPGRITYLPNFLNLDEYEPRYESGSYAVYAGRIERVKGVSTLLDAISSAPLGFDLKVAGDGELRGELEQRALARSLPVQFLGRLPADKLRALIQASRFVVVPSEWYENAPMSVLEAYALGKPVIAASMGGIPELVEPGVTGLLFEPGNPAALREAINHLIARPELAVAMGRNARRFVEQRFCPGAHLQGLLEIYAEAENTLRASKETTR